MSIDIRNTWVGSHYPKPNIKLKAGSISMLYEKGSIRYIAAGEHEIIRMVYSAVRDREWLNVKPVIISERIERYSDSFRIEYTCKYNSGENEFKACYVIEGKPDNRIIFSLEGEAITPFEKNRIGFCVLHPIEGLAGNRCNISHSDGSEEQAFFPSAIYPDLVFSDIRSMKWTIGEMECFLEFSGDIFETEDQRNWTDASYKTYSTPQTLPAPVRLERGDKISQKIIFSSGKLSDKLNEKEKVLEFSLNTESALPLPKIGIGRSTRKVALSDNEISILKKIPFDHYRSDIYLFEPGWEEDANQSVTEATKLGYSLELVLFFDDNYREQSEALKGWLSAAKIKPSGLLLFHKSIQVTPGYLSEYIAQTLGNRFPDIKIIIGTNANFAQLNMNRPSTDHCDLLCYSVHPQEHASDSTTLVENLQAQAYTVESAKIFSGDKGIWVSPVNIQRRFNANIENFENPSSGDSFPAQADNRMMSLFGACWTAGSIKYLGESGVTGITFYETVGERGIFQGEFKTVWPDIFLTSPGKIFPVFHLFRWLLEDKSFNIIKSISSVPLKADILALRKGNKLKMAIFNPGNENQTIQLKDCMDSLTMYCLEAEKIEISGSDPSWILNDNRSVIKAENPFTINPYSVTFLDGTFLAGK